MEGLKIRHRLRVYSGRSMRRLEVVAILCLLSAITPGTWALHSHKFIFGRPMHGFRLQEYSVDEVQKKMSDGELPGMTSGFFDQTLNHNANKEDDGKTFKQKFYMNDACYDGGPDFIYIGGEAPESGSAIMLSSGKEPTSIMKWAREQKARVWALEHRFYGESRPFPTQTTDVLMKYLNSEQALADLAAFITAKNTELSIANPRWVVFGGSYAGALALWFQAKYPDLCLGAVGSSAPVEPQIDFYDYLRVCQDSYQSKTWGSSDCSDMINSAFTAVQRLMDYKEGRDYLDDAFKLFPRLSQQLLDDQEIANFYSTLISYFQGAVQYNRVNGGIYKDKAGIPEVCYNMTHTESFSSIAGLVNVFKYYAEVYGLAPDKLFDSYKSTIDMLKDPNYYGNGEMAAARSWTWQTCNEFGYFQSTDMGYNIFQDSIPNSFYINMCADVFGPDFDYDYIKKSVKNTLKTYGGRKGYKGSKVVAPNGNIDPWHALGLHKEDVSNLNKGVVIVPISGTAHCADMEPESSKDSKSLKDARKIIYGQIKKWLAASPPHRQKRMADVVEADVVEADVVETDVVETDVVETDVVEANKIDEKMVKREASIHSKMLNEPPKKPSSKTQPNNHLRMRVKKPSSKTGPNNHPKMRVKKPDNPPAPLYTKELIDQLVDHSNTDLGTFSQLTYKVTKFEKDPTTAPVILFILLSDIVETYAPDENAPIAKMAADLSATILFVRTRYFGDSKPPTSKSNLKDLKYLTLSQILEDIKYIIDKHLGITPNSPKKVLVVGSGTGGTIAAHFRKTYPDYVVGALASSSPIDFQLTYPDGADFIQKAFLTYNGFCSFEMSAFFDQIHKWLMNRDGRAKLVGGEAACATGFPDANYVDPMNKAVFKYKLMEHIIEIASFVGEDPFKGMPNGLTLESFCLLMTNPALSEVEKLVAMFPEECIPTSYEDFKKPFLKTTYNDPTANDMRVNAFMRCNEIGFLPNTDSGYSIFGNLITPNFFVNLCKDIFELSHDDMQKNIEKTRATYGGAEAFDTVKNIIFTYGTFDLNSPASYHNEMETATTDDRVQLEIQNAGISNDLIAGSNTQDSKDARDKILAYFKKWLQ